MRSTSKKKRKFAAPAESIIVACTILAELLFAFGSLGERLITCATNACLRFELAIATHASNKEPDL